MTNYLKYFIVIILLVFISETSKANRDSIDFSHQSCTFSLSRFNPWNKYNLIKAILRDDLNTTRHLLMTGRANVNMKDRRIFFSRDRLTGWTPLMYAIDEGNLEIARLLIDFGADVNTQDEDGSTTLMIAVDNDDIEAIKFLLKFGVQIDLSDDDGSTELLIAAEGDNVEAIKLLVDAGADVNAQDEDGWTALMHNLDDSELVEFLTDYEVDFNFKGYLKASEAYRKEFGKNPLDYPDSAKFLEEHGAKLTSEDIASIIEENT